MKAIKLFISVLLIFIVAACDNELGIEYPFENVTSYHLIDVYQEWNGVELMVSGDNALLLLFRENGVESFIVSDQVAKFCNMGTNRYNGASTEGFEELAALHGDRGYEWKFGVRYDMGGKSVDDIFCHFALARGIKQIDVVSDKDFDAHHPAGKSLNDIVKFIGFSYAQYLAPDVNKKGVDVAKISPIEKSCGELTALDLKLIDNVNLVFTTASTKKQIHNITVIIVDVADEVYSSTIEMEF